MKILPLPSLEVLHQHLDYNPETGDLTWKIQYGRGRIGQSVGNTSNNGYRTFQFLGRRLKAHRVCWAMYYNQDVPEGMIVDHVNGNRDDNRIANLRATTSLVNNYNVNNPRKNKSGVTGVHPHHNRWVVIVGNERVGRYDTFEEAVAVREQALAERLRNITIPA